MPVYRWETCPKELIALMLPWIPEILNIRKDIYPMKTLFHYIIISDFSNYDLANLFFRIKWQNPIKWYQV